MVCIIHTVSLILVDRLLILIVNLHFYLFGLIRFKLALLLMFYLHKIYNHMDKFYL